MTTGISRSPARVVHTSTTGAIGLSHSSGPLLDETHWHDDPQTTYFQAKTKSERIAWQVADELGFEARLTRETLDHTIRWLVHSGALSPKVEKRLREKCTPDPAWN